MNWVILSVLLLAGILLMIAGFRGRRVDDHPICRKCRFDLQGVHGRVERCPECGGSLAGAAAVRKGNRKRRRGAIALGVSVLLAALIPAGIIAGDARGVNWNTYKPEWWLTSDVKSSDRSVSDAAIREIAIRLRDRKISTRVAQEVLERSLDHQADRSQRWSEAAGEYLEAARAFDLMSPEQLQRYARAAVEVRVRAATATRERAPWLIELTANPRLARNTNLAVRIQTIIIDINGQTMAPHPPHHDPAFRINAMSLRGGGLVMSVVNLADPALLALAPGEHEVALRSRIAITENLEDALHEWDEEFTVRNTVLALSAPTQDPGIELVKDESLREAMEKAISMGQHRIIGPPGAQQGVEGGDEKHILSGYGTISFRQPPMDAAFDIYWRYNDPESEDGVTELQMGNISMAAGTFLGFGGAGRLLPEGFSSLGLDTVDVVLRASITEAAKEKKFTRIWDGELVYRDVPLSWPEKVPTAIELEDEIPQK